MNRPSEPLYQLAAVCGIQTSYLDVNQKRQAASAESLRAVLAAWGVQVESPREIQDALETRRREKADRLLPPVVVAWDGKLARIPLGRLPGNGADSVQLQCHCETGEILTRKVRWEVVSGDRVQSSSNISSEFDPRSTPTGDAVAFVGWPDTLPLGYHQLSVVDEAQEVLPTLVVAAPRASFHSPGRQRTWGVFAPVYAIHSESSWGGGNFSDLQRLWEWVVQRGGSFVATLPLTAAFLDEPFEFSPYAPASRLFWNEFFVDVPRVAAQFDSPAARDLLDRVETREAIGQLRQRPLVDYRRQMQLARQILEPLAESCFSTDGPQQAAVRQFLAARPEVDDYAQFRAVTARQGRTWSNWPDRLHHGVIQSEDFDEKDRRYHIFVQWAAQQQIQQLIDRASASGDGLYLDMPLGVHHQGYDTWRNREVFALQAAGGAPPDSFFTKGQNWGFPPLHPERLRDQRYRYWIASLRHQLQHAGMLRIDHIMQLHRLYWVPDGMDARSGAYVRYPAEELYAILCLESQRHQCILVGENLGTVPEEVNADMRSHLIDQIYVMQYEIPAQPDSTLSAVPRRSIASMNTHDMPLFAAFWKEEDLGQLHQLGLFDDDELAQQQQQRRQIRRNLILSLELAGLWPQISASGSQAGSLDPDSPDWKSADLAALLDALHHWLAQSQAESMTVNLEDLWLETEPQNTPGTSHERANWQRRFRYSLENLCESEEWADRLSGIAHERPKT
jgi:4-alpha-glucanotransferase